MKFGRVRFLVRALITQAKQFQEVAQPLGETKTDKNTFKETQANLEFPEGEGVEFMEEKKDFET